MLGFSAFSETSFSQASTASLANAFLVGAEAISYVDSIGPIALANVTLTSAASSVTLGSLAYDAKANTDTGSVTAATAISQFFDVTAQAGALITGAESAADAGTIGYQAKAVLDINSVSGITYAGEVSTEAKANVTTDNVTAVTYAGTFDVEAQASITSPSVSLSGFINAVDTEAAANTVANYISAFTYVNAPYTEAKASVTSSSVSATTYVNDLADILGAASTLVDSVTAKFYQTKPSANAVKFNYSPTDYSTQRVLYLVTYDTNTNNTVYIKPENYTVFVQKKNGSNTVYIAA